MNGVFPAEPDSTPSEQPSQPNDRSPRGVFVIASPTSCCSSFPLPTLVILDRAARLLWTVAPKLVLAAPLCSVALYRKPTRYRLCYRALSQRALLSDTSLSIRTPGTTDARSDGYHTGEYDCRRHRRIDRVLLSLPCLPWARASRASKR